MQQYLDLLKTIKEKGSRKEPARAGMPGTTSLFGYQFRHDLSEGFPLLTTKKLGFKNIVLELLWFLKGDTNIKYLVDNGCNIWNEDAYNYYLKVHSDWERKYLFDFHEFVMVVKMSEEEREVYLDKSGMAYKNISYTIGDCGKQYGWLWRNWEDQSGSQSFIVDTAYIPKLKMEEIDLEKIQEMMSETGILPIDSSVKSSHVDQIKELIKGLKENPLSRRHIINAWNPTTLNDMALNACHALVQFNCRPLTEEERYLWGCQQPFNDIMRYNEKGFSEVDDTKIPRYKLDCQMYQRSADVFLGVPYNIASYALMTHILAKICNMIPGDFIHTFGDVHIYDNHMDQVDLQLSRDPKSLPTFNLEVPSTVDEFEYLILNGGLNPDYLTDLLKDYNPHSAIKGKLSTGLR